MLPITQFPLTRCDCYNDGKFLKPPKGLMIHSTATPGVMALDFAKAWNKSYKAKETNRQVATNGFVDNKTIVQCFDWTKRTWHCGKTVGNDKYIAFEICEPSGHYYKSGYGAKMFNYNPVAQQEYFEAIWKNATELSAMLCKMFGWDPLDPKVLLDHSEGYQLGIASNHGDVSHWFPKHGKSMNDFRAEVYELLKPESTLLYRVQAGVFSDKAKATTLANRLKKAGFEAYIATIEQKG